jgi:hypothetical protein
MSRLETADTQPSRKSGKRPTARRVRSFPNRDEGLKRCPKPRN